MSQRYAVVTNILGKGATELALALAGSGFTTFCHSDDFADHTTRTAFDRAYPELLSSHLTNIPDFIAEALTRFGKVDAAVANLVGDLKQGPLEGMTLDDYREALAQYAVQPLCLAKSLLPSMKARRQGRIVVITRTAEVAFRPGLVIHSVAREATNAIVRALDIEIGAFNLTINLIARIESAHNEFLGMDVSPDRDLSGDPSRMQSSGKLSEISQLVNLLAGGQADLISGKFFTYAE